MVVTENNTYAKQLEVNGIRLEDLLATPTMPQKNNSENNGSND